MTAARLPEWQSTVGASMETRTPDRRARGVRRIPLQTLVELCSLQEGGPAFEAQSLDLSGRGMRVRSEFVPPLQMPVVLRFTHESREVVVEGEVAWQRAGEPEGEFGIRFTALDSNSVLVLKQLCTGEGPEPAPVAAEPVSPPIELSFGAPVKLHLQGLAAPMKARVFESGARLLKVGSQLEFLKLGRPLHLDLVDHDARREARIETVDVAVDPETQIPQLLVSVRYQECGDDTPEPAVIDSDPTSRADHSAVADEHYSGVDADDDLDPVEGLDDDDTDAAEALLKSRVSIWAQHAGDSLRSTGRRLAGVGGETLGLFSGLATRAAASANKLPGKKKPRRTTTRLQSKAARGGPTVTSSSQGRRTRGVRTSAPRARPASQSARWWAAAAVFGVGVGAAAVFTASDESEFKQRAEEFAAATSAPASDPQAFPERATLDDEEQLKPGQRGIVADVPLFGPTQMAAAEPGATEVTAKGKGSVDEVSLAKDQSFDDKPAPAQRVGEASADEFQVGRMHLPVIHRLRLDAPGENLQGSKTPSGFTVLIPGRKLMESGAGIAKRDDRIVDVRTTNTPAGAKVVFRFRGDIPGYKARLRNDYVEFFVNSPQK